MHARLLSALAIGLLSTSLALAQDAEPTAEEAPAVEAPAPEPTATEKALAAVPALYLRRDRAGVAAEAIALLDAALAEDPDNFELHWRVARYHFWLGDTASNDTTKTAESKTCWDHAEKAIALNPAAVQGHYWSMACIGTYSEGVGIINAVRQGLAPKFEAAGLKAASIDANYDSGGPLRGLGRYYDQLPWPLRDAGKSRDYLQRALKVDPNHPRNLYYMADLELEEGNEAEAKALLEKVLALSEAGSNPPEVRRYHTLARALMAEIDD